MTDDDLDLELLKLLRDAHKKLDEARGNGAARTTSALALSVAKQRVQTRLEALEAEGRVKKSTGRDAWMIVGSPATER
jgi:hypothetical protein